jgi:hypothetical protein
MHSFAASIQTTSAYSAPGVLLAGRNNNRANNNASRWRVRA